MNFTLKTQIRTISKGLFSIFFFVIIVHQAVGGYGNDIIFTNAIVWYLIAYHLQNVVNKLRIFIGNIVVFLDGDYSIIIFFFSIPSKLVPIEDIYKLVYIINILYVVAKHDHSINKAPPFSKLS